MSGGGYSYIHEKLSVGCEDRMYGAEMDEMIKGLCKVLHDLEWWVSGDISEARYRQTVSWFKKKMVRGRLAGTAQRLHRQPDRNGSQRIISANWGG